MIDGLQRLALGAGAFQFWFVVIALAGVALYALRKGADGFWRLRIIVDTPTARIRSAPQGYVELSGTALPLPHRGPLTAPLTRLPCVWYRFKVQKRQRSTKHDHWVTVEQGEAPTPFLLDDGSGRCLVEPEGAELSCRAKDVWQGSHARAPKRGSSQWFQVARDYRLTEERILDSEQVYLLGRYETPRRGAKEREHLTRELLSGWKRDPERMAGFDRNGDGEIDLEEWERARAKAGQIAERSESRLRAEPPLSRVLRTGDPRHPFLISTLGEGALLRRLQLWTYGGTAVFVLLVGGVGIAVVSRLAGG